MAVGCRCHGQWRDSRVNGGLYGGHHDHNISSRRGGGGGFGCDGLVGKYLGRFR